MKLSISAVCTVAIVMITMVFQNCASNHDPGSNDFAQKILGSGACTQILKDGFVTTGYHNYVRTWCTDCHTLQGNGTGEFADVDPNIAANDFILRTEETIAERALSSHRAGEEHKAEVPNLSAAWDEVEIAFAECKTSSGESDDANPIGGGDIATPSLFTASKPYNVAAGNQVTMSWAGAELGQAAGAGVTATIELTMEAYDFGGGVTGYFFTAPRLVNDVGQAIYINGLGVRIGGQMVPNGTTWYSLERHVPANDSRQLAPTGGAIIYASELGEDLDVSLGVTQLVVSSIPNFNPPTYEDLQGNGNLFTLSCGPCHQGNGFGGFDISYQVLLGGTGSSGRPLIQKFNLDGSEFYVRMESVNAPMPTSGILPEAQRNQVRDWILDGAPQNANDVAR